VGETAIVVCTWFHMIVLVIWLGHMFNALLLFAPLTKKYVKENVYGDFIAEYRRRDQPVAIGCIVIFLITGYFLMTLNEQYKGIGDIFANSWSIILFVKHLLFLAMIGLGVYQGKRVMPNLAQAGKQLAAPDETKQEVTALVSRLDKTRQTVTQALCGLAILVLLLTAVGEIFS
jgi:uncharacterized membrane protein